MEVFRIGVVSFWLELVWLGGVYLRSHRDGLRAFGEVNFGGVAAELFELLSSRQLVNKDKIIVIDLAIYLALFGHFFVKVLLLLFKGLRRV